MGVFIVMFLGHVFATALSLTRTNFTETNFNIASESPYPPNLDVEFTVRHSSPANFTLNFTHFSLERSDDCKFDSLTITDSISPSPLLGPLCGNISEDNRSAILELSYGFRLLFKSDSTDQSEGFSLNVTTSTLPHYQICDYMHERQAGFLRSNIGEANYTYPTNLNCSWAVSGQPNKQIVLQFYTLDVEFSGPDCLYDHLEVWDIQGKDNSSVDTLLAKVCGRHNPWSLPTNSSEIRISFFSDSLENIGQFVIGYNRTAPLMDVSTRVKITDVTPIPRTESMFADDMNQGLPLIWKFRTRPGFSVQIVMNTFSNQGISLYDGPDRSFQNIWLSPDQNVASSKGFHLIVSLSLTAHSMFTQDNVTFWSQHNMPSISFNLNKRFDYTYRTIVEHVCKEISNCQSKHMYESFLQQFPNVGNCAYAGLAVYDEDVDFNKFVGTFCNIGTGYMYSFFPHLLSSQNNLHVLYYEYDANRSTQYVHAYFNISVEPSSSCRAYILTEHTHKQNQSYNSYNFSLNATVKDGQHYISIDYERHTWDCVIVQVIANLTPMKQINLLLKGNFTYSLCRLGAFKAFPGNMTKAASLQNGFSKRCSRRKDGSNRATETIPFGGIHGWSLEYILVELGSAPIIHKDIHYVVFILKDTLYITGRGIVGGSVLNLTSDKLYEFFNIFFEKVSLQVRLANSLPAGYHVHLTGTSCLFNISEENGKMGTDVLWAMSPQRIDGPRNYFQYRSMSGSLILISFVETPVCEMYMHIQALRFRQLPPSLASTPAKERCVLFEDNCYTFHQSAIDTSWNGARTVCREYGGDLVSVNSYEELQFLKGSLSSVWFSDFYGKRRGLIYIGLSDVKNASDYRWVDGSPLTFADWYYPFDTDITLPQSPQPPIDRDHMQPVPDQSQRCVAMVPGNSFSSTNWQKISCDVFIYPETVYSICEYNNTSSFERNTSKIVSEHNDTSPFEDTRSRTTNRLHGTVQKYRCEDGWIFVHNTCLIVLRSFGSLQGEDAENMCTKYGGHLMLINSLSGSRIDSLFTSIGLSESIGYVGDIWFKVTSGYVVCIAANWDSQVHSFKYENCLPEYLYAKKHIIICQKDRVERKLDCRPYQFKCEDGTCLTPDRICDLNKDCLHGEDETNCNLQGHLYNCHEFTGQKISVSRYCDFHYDCYPEWDEDCSHRACSRDQFKCDNEQCISIDQRCDKKVDCIDESDEEDCDWQTDCPGFRCPFAGCVVSSHVGDLQADCLDKTDADEKEESGGRYVVNELDCPGKLDHIRCHKDHAKCYPASKVCVYDHDSFGRLKYCSNGAHLRYCREHECPDMFKCPASYCIPYHKVCDGVQDCVRGEDESSCDDNTCPGMLKCGSTNQCVPQQNICDQEVNCKYDWSDEMFCDLENYSCPLNCKCIGYYVDCSDQQIQHVLDISPMKAVRGLNLRNNNITALTNLQFINLAMLYLQHNIIRNLSSRPFASLKNLAHLDLSFNRIEVIPAEAFEGLIRLEILELAGNPVRQIPEHFPSLYILTLNLSRMSLEELGPRRFEKMYWLKSLDLSNNKIRQLEPETFVFPSPLDALYLHDNFIELSKPDALQNLDVRILTVDSFRLCCAAGGLVRSCSPPVEDVSRCADLHPTVLIRGIVWVFAILAILGNVFVISWRLYKRLSDVPSVLIFHLSISDLLMGLYLLSISVVDLHYRDIYILHDVKWRKSVYCKFIGVMGFISCEMSMYTLVMIAVDRTKKLAFPLSSGQITVAHAWIIQLVGWGFWTTVSVCPLIVPAYFGDYYGRNSFCLPFNFANPHGSGWEITTFIFVCLNSIGLTMIIAMYVLIFLKVKESQKKSGRRDRIEVDIARKLSIIIVTDLACMLPIVLTNFMSVLGIPIDRGMALILANLVLPLNSALNPFLFTLNTLKLPATCPCKAQLSLGDTKRSSL